MEKYGKLSLDFLSVIRGCFRSDLRIGYILTLTVITMFSCLNGFTDLCHNALETSASWNKTMFDFHLFDTLYALKSDDELDK